MLAVRRLYPVRRFRPLVHAGILLCGLGGCAANGPSPVPPSLCDEAARVRRELFPFGTKTTADEAAIAAEVLPGGFAALYQDLVRGVLVVGLVNIGESADALKALTELLQCYAIYPGWLGTRLSLGVVDVRRADFRGDSLWTWAARVQGLGPSSGIWSTEVDPLMNRIWIGVDDMDLVNEIRDRIDAAAVPLGAVVIEPPPLPDLPPGPLRVLASIILVEDRPSFGWAFDVPLEHANTEAFPVYQDRCVIPGTQPLRSEPQYRLEKWDGTRWRTIFRPVCEAILVKPPVSVPAAGARRDTANVLATYRLQAQPVWDNSRIAGYYRLVVPLFRSAGGEPPLLMDPFPDEYGRTPYFRLRAFDGP